MWRPVSEQLRADPAMDNDIMRRYIQDFSLDDCKHGNQGYSRVLIQLFGFTGHGKSSFINSCKYVVDDGPYKVYARVAPSEYKPETMIRSTYELTRTITLVDNRGCVILKKDETGEIYAQLGNFLPLNTTVNWHAGYEDTLNRILESEREERSADFIVPVLVYNSQLQMSSDDDSNLKEMLVMARDITGNVSSSQGG
ncbi:uncharacterized protein [Pyxicephalus adspersus]|uniref:uncharacterized protein isoform X2 n=1 Tax=Pyxicephalus adspersus TaxID=30357 RepID=UPI003B5AFE98